MRLARSVTVLVVAVAAATVGITAASASPVSVQDARVAGAGAVTLPGKIMRHAHSNVRANSRIKNAAATLASTNWAGYVGTAGGYTTVTASWFQPTVSCTSNGVVSFWAGLDGWGDNTVEQTGTGVDCRSGSPKYYAWWETFPTNSQQTYTGVPVSPGDTITATVTFTNSGQYELDLADKTQGWSKTTVAAAPSGSSNISAEVITEAASLGSNVTALPDFGGASYFWITIDGQQLPAAGAQPMNMVNNSGSVIALCGGIDSNGNFGITYTGGNSAVQAAFQAADGTMHTYGASGDMPQGIAMMGGTSPSITQLATGGVEEAYQGSNGDLMVAGAAGAADLDLPMAAGTSPSIISIPGGGYQIAYQSDAGMLSSYTTGSAPANLGAAMLAGTSPSTTMLSDGSIQIAFQASSGRLWTYSSLTAKTTSLGLKMSPGSSPSLIPLSGQGYLIAFNANSNDLWTYTSATASASATSGDRGVAMAAGTSPSLATGTNSGWGVAMQGSNGYLWTFTASSGAQNDESSTDQMAAGTSPAIVAVSGGYESALQTSGGTFEVFGAAGPTINTLQPMLGGTSPDIVQ